MGSKISADIDPLDRICEGNMILGSMGELAL